MRAADASRICQYRNPANPSKICGKPLLGRGRHKWCPACESLVREEQRKARNAVWQRAWRKRHPGAFFERRVIPQMAGHVCNLLHSKYGLIRSRTLYAKILDSFRYLFTAQDETVWMQGISYRYLHGDDYVFWFATCRRAKSERYFGCVSVRDSSGILDRKRCYADKMQYLLAILNTWALALGWNGETGALIVVLGPLMHSPSGLGFCYIEFLEGRRYRRDVFWCGDQKGHGPRDARARFNRLLWRGLKETKGDAQAWKVCALDTFRELQAEGSSGN
jgi:hypothetical protein